MLKNDLIARNDRYSRKVNRLLAELESLPEEMLNKKPVKGGWSAIQTIYHLILAEELSLAYVKKKLSFNPETKPAGAGARWRGFLLWAYLSTPLKFKAPKNIAEENLPAFAGLAVTRARWHNVRDAWEDFFKQMPENLTNKAIYKHPRAGRLGWNQMLSFFETHFDRHLAQVKRVLLESGNGNVNL